MPLSTARSSPQFAVFILQFAICNSPLTASGQARAPPIDPTVTRLPKLDPAVQQAQFAPPPLPYPQTVPPPAPLVPATPPGQTSFRNIKVLPRAAGLGPNIRSATSPTGEKVAVIDGGVNVHRVGSPVFSENLAVAFDKSSELDNASAVQRVGEIIQEMHDDGTLRELSMKWFSEDLTASPTQ